MRKLLTLSTVAVLLFAGVAAGKPPAPPSGAATPKSPQISGTLGSQPVLQPYTSAEGRFTVSFPGGTPKLDTETVKKDGGTITLYEFWTELENSNVSYMLMYNDYSPDYANGDPQTVLASTRDGAVNGKKLLSDMAINLNGVPGREFTTKDDTWNYTLRQFLKGKRLYQLIIVSSDAHPATQTSAFLDSFRIN
jgi:hypothetical protein